MKSYPSITKEIRQDLYIYAFDKIDGSNIRAEWNAKRGFYKFGTRHQLIDEKSQPFGVAIPLLRQKYEADLTAIFRDLHWESVICFFELWGPDSFAGNHNFQQPLDITLIDVNAYKQGLLPPEEFLQHFQQVDIAKLLYQGEVSVRLFDMVKQSTLPGMTGEGVVCKAMDPDYHTKMPVMFKIKSQAWLDRLKEYCQGDEGLFQKLA